VVVDGEDVGLGADILAIHHHRDALQQFYIRLAVFVNIFALLL